MGSLFIRSKPGALEHFGGSWLSGWVGSRGQCICIWFPADCTLPASSRNLLLFHFLNHLVRVSLGLKFVLVNFLDKDFFTF